MKHKALHFLPLVRGTSHYSLLITHYSLFIIHCEACFALITHYKLHIKHFKYFFLMSSLYNNMVITNRTSEEVTSLLGIIELHYCLRAT